MRLIIDDIKYLYNAQIKEMELKNKVYFYVSYQARRKIQKYLMTLIENLRSNIPEIIII